MNDRLELQTLLEVILGSSNVYFQPPENGKIKYPCIIYERSGINTKYADNNPYANKKRYTLTVIDPNPDSIFPDKIIELTTCSFDKHYTKDNLNHDVFNLYY